MKTIFSSYSKLYYCSSLDNFGDELSPYILKRLCGSDFSRAQEAEDNKIVAVGSLLNYEVLHSKSLVWGSGVLTRKSLNLIPKFFPLNRCIKRLYTRLKDRRPIEAQIVALRGPLSKELLGRVLEKSSPPLALVFGDPGIILPRIYEPKCLAPRYPIGLILHYSQESLIDNSLLEEKGIHVISIKRSGDAQLEEFIDEVNACEAIFSSSLHGIIVAQAYGVPAQWIQIEGEAIHSDGDLKFKDYFLGAKVPVQRPLVIGKKLEDFEQLKTVQAPSDRVPDEVIDTLLKSIERSL